MSLRRTLLLLSIALAASPASALAQSLGSFRWQLQPYCNVVTVNVTQQGSIYILDGTDDRCGGGNQPASVTGIAYLTPLGLVGFGLTSVVPGGAPIHTEATIDIASLSGTWRDSAGHNGTFVFTAGAPAPGAPRPVPAVGSAPVSQFASGDQTVVLAAADQVVRAITITAPTAGRIITNASGYFWFVSGATTESARCSITSGAAIDFSHLIIATENAVAAMTFVPFAATRGFEVAAGSHTYNLVCDLADGTVAVADSSLTGIFVPNTP